MKFWCRKITRRCGENHIIKSKCEKTGGLGPLFEVQMSKNCTPLWREAHLEVNMLNKTDGLGALFEVAMSKNCTRLWRKEHFEVKMCKTRQQRTVF